MARSVPRSHKLNSALRLVGAQGRRWRHLEVEAARGAAGREAEPDGAAPVSVQLVHTDHVPRVQRRQHVLRDVIT